MKIDLVREGDALFLVADDAKVITRNERGEWRAAEPGWGIHFIDLWGMEKGQKWDGIEFGFEGEVLRPVFYIDPEGNPHAVQVTDAPRPAGRA